MVNQPPTETPFGLEPNVAAGLAYLFPFIGGIVMLVGGGTNAFVKWAAAQSITWFGVYIVVEIALGFLMAFLHIVLLVFFISWIVWLLAIATWLWTTIAAFGGREVRLPWIADVTTSIFKSTLA